MSEEARAYEARRRTVRRTLEWIKSEEDGAEAIRATLDALSTYSEEEIREALEEDERGPQEEQA